MFKFIIQVKTSQKSVLCGSICCAKICIYCDILCVCSYSVPMKSENRNKWIQASEKHQEFDYKVSRFFVCELHFTADSLQKRGLRTDVAPGAVPTIFPTHEIEYLDEDAIYLNDYPLL